jgi:hypothetical protein
MTEKLTFTGRTFELNYLDGQYAEPLGTLCVVYGRRRVGKTRLLTHWLANRDVLGFYWLATDSTPRLTLSSILSPAPFTSKFTARLQPIPGLPTTTGMNSSGKWLA